MHKNTMLRTRFSVFIRKWLVSNYSMDVAAAIVSASNASSREKSSMVQLRLV